MRKPLFGYLIAAAVGAVVFATVPHGRTATTASPPITSDGVYTFRPAPTYRASTREEMLASAFDSERRRQETHARTLRYALTGLVILSGAIFLISFLAARRRKIGTAVESAAVGALAGVVKAKRRIRQKVEDRITGRDGS